MMHRREAVRTLRDALAEGELEWDDLTARGVAEFLGATTSVVYHHWGSLDALLFDVSKAGYEWLGERLTNEIDDGDLEDVAVAFVAFGLEHPDLYALMFERHYDWDALRQRGVFDEDLPGLGIWDRLVTFLDEAGSEEPQGDARLLFGGLHGLVSLASTGRANIGNLERSDRRTAEASARRLVRRISSNWSADDDETT